MSEQHLIVETKGAIGHIRLNRPDLHNAFSGDIVRGIADAIQGFEADDTVRAVLLTGEGKSFSAGGDLKWMREAVHFTEEQNRDDAIALSDMLARLFGSRKPVIAVVQGAVMGGGVGLVSCADIVIAVEGTRFALSEVKLGLTPATISPYVVKAMGLRWARRLFVTGEFFDAERAADINLVHETAPTLEAAMERADAIISLILKNGPEAVTHAKQLAIDVAEREVTEALRIDTAERIAARRVSDEGQEGLAAFLEKRAPNWVKG